MSGAEISALSKKQKIPFRLRKKPGLSACLSCCRQTFLKGKRNMIIEIEVSGQRQTILSSAYSAQQSENCLECSFNFTTPEWQGLVKTAHFKAESGREVYSVVLSDDKCIVPSAVLEEDGYFSFSVIGEKENYRITTGAVSVLNRKAVYGGEPQEQPQETQYEQMVALAANAVSAAQEAEAIADQIKADAESGKFKGEKGDKGDTGPQGPKGEAGDDYALTQQDKFEIAELTKNISGVKMSAYFPHNEEELISATEEIMLNFGNYSPVLLMPCMDSNEMNAVYGEGYILIDTGDASVENAVVIPLCYSERPFTESLRGKIDTFSEFFSNFGFYNSYKMLTPTDQNGLKVYTGVGEYDFTEYKPCKMLFSFTLSKNLGGILEFIVNGSKTITFSADSLVSSASDITADVEIEIMDNILVFRVTMFSDTGIKHFAQKHSVLGGMISLAVQNELNVNYAYAKGY